MLLEKLSEGRKSVWVRRLWPSAVSFIFI